MERMCEQGADADSSLVTADKQSAPTPLPFSMKEIFALLNIPHDALRHVDAALFLLKQCDMVAYYWRDYSQRPQIKFFSLDVVQGTFGTLPFDSGPLPANALRVGMNAAGRRCGRLQAVGKRAEHHRHGVELTPGPLRASTTSRAA